MNASLRNLLNEPESLVFEVENPILAHVLTDLPNFETAFESYKWPIGQNSVSALLFALKIRDKTTFSHVLRCGTYAHLLGQQENKELIGEWTLLALLHDLGKMGIPDEILRDTGELPLRAFEQVKQHASFGQELVRRAGLSDELSMCIRSHHERLDGYGYPDGISGDKIPEASRMILVIDTFDALTSNRPYRSGLSYVDAFEEMRKSMGSQLDKRFTKVFITILSEHIDLAEKRLGLDTLPRIA